MKFTTKCTIVFHHSWTQTQRIFTSDWVSKYQHN